MRPRQISILTVEEDQTNPSVSSPRAFVRHNNFQQSNGKYCSSLKMTIQFFDKIQTKMKVDFEGIIIMTKKIL